MRSFTFTHHFWTLLHLHQLPIRKDRPVMNHLHLITSTTVFAVIWMINATSVHHNLHSMTAHRTREVSHLQVWYYIAGSDDHTLDGDELVDVFRIQVSHP